VTHELNITALTDVATAEGEIVVLRPTEAATIAVIGSVRM
jgi:hypothetical protein